jgi:predicted metal-dependent hydrolase
MEVAEPLLTAGERVLFERGVEEFNQGRFFECHDTLEDLWSGLRGPSRDFFQGLIQVAVAFYHWTNGNRAGAESLLGRALKRLGKYPDRYFGFELGTFRAELERCVARVRSGQAPGELPKWCFEV